MDLSLVKKTGNDYYGLEVVNGDFAIKDQKIEIQQRVLINLLTFRGENFASPDSGVDYKNNVFPFNAEDVTMQDAFKAAILGTTGVTGLIEFNLTQEKESLKLDALINTEAGEIRVNLENIL